MLSNIHFHWYIFSQIFWCIFQWPGPTIHHIASNVLHKMTSYEPIKTCIDCIWNFVDSNCQFLLSFNICLHLPESYKWINLQIYTAIIVIKTILVLQFSSWYWLNENPWSMEFFLSYSHSIELFEKLFKDRF